MANTVLGKFLVKKKELQCAKLKDAFAVFDKHNTGFIKCEDLGKVLRSIGDNPTDYEVKDVIGVVDVDKNGVVEFSNLFNFLAKDGELEKDLKPTFKLLDKDGDWFIYAVEFSDASDEKAKSMVKTGDLDGDGKVSYEYFKKMLFRMCDST